MDSFILHHFDASPFAEKIRVAFGIKGIAWHSVEIPMIMPKPDLMPLTGGYRKTPVLQIGAEIYCDTNLILRELERRKPEPALFPAGIEGLAAGFASWSDKTFFEPGAVLSMALNTEVPQALLADRIALFGFPDFDDLQASVPHRYGQFLAQVAVLESQLRDGREYLAGPVISALDVLAWFPLWMAHANVPDIGPRLSAFVRTAAWAERMRACGNGHREEMTAAVALDIAAVHEPAEGTGVEPGSDGLQPGTQVTVTPTDCGAVPVRGALLTLDCERICLRRKHARVGEVNTHFPRSGYRVEAV